MPRSSEKKVKNKTTKRETKCKYNCESIILDVNSPNHFRRPIQIHPLKALSDQVHKLDISRISSNC